MVGLLLILLLYFPLLNFNYVSVLLIGSVHTHPIVSLLLHSLLLESSLDQLFQAEANYALSLGLS